MVELSIRDEVAYVTLNRPEKCNALNFETFKRLDKIIKTLKKDRRIRAVVLLGSGSDFCSGLDVAATMASPATILRLLFKWLPGNANLAQRVVLGWQDLPVPVIALIQGRCWGGGMQIALGADYRIATPDASLAIMEARWGLCPDMGAHCVLPGLLRRDQAQWLTSHADPVTAERALALGLVGEISEDLTARLDDMLASIKQRSPDTLAAVKRIAQSAYGTSRRRILARETWSQVRLLLSANTRIAVARAKGSQDAAYKPRARW